MRTGEGKTLVGVFPAYLNALSGKGVHLVTVNDYLARRDSDWVGQIHRFLGLNVGLIQAGMGEKDRRTSYLADITYVTNSELGFDYLRDNLAVNKDDLVLREFHYCIIDEVDSILIDEARTPLIISGLSESPSDKYMKANKIAQAMTRDFHYTLDEKQRDILITDNGYEAAEDILEISDLYDPKNQWATYLINAIKAKELFLRDTNYIIRENEILIVDEFTGRTMPGRRWSDGLHQAIEAKEDMPIQQENLTLASISYQNLFLAYSRLAGMTGTAVTEAAEFSSIYDLAVTIVPTNQPVKRIDNPDVVFKKDVSKWRAVLAEVQRIYEQQRPILLGTTSVDKSERIAEKLIETNIPFHMLNAKPENVEKESDIIAQSGRKKAVTISTNMAGRGTDILLGGNPDFLARLKLREVIMPEIIKIEEKNKDLQTKQTSYESSLSITKYPCDLTQETQTLLNLAGVEAKKIWGERSLSNSEVEERLSVACEKIPSEDPVITKLRTAFQAIKCEYTTITTREKAEVVSLGGLHVIGTERHESRRIDNQLRGRAGRQGDPGSNRFFISLDDNLFRIFGGDRLKSMMTAFNIDELPIESQLLTKSLDEAQQKVEKYYFEIRKNLFEYDKVLNVQRERVYADRKSVLLATDLSCIIEEYVAKTIDDIVEFHLASIKNKPIDTWPLQILATKIQHFCCLTVNLTGKELQEQCNGSLPFETLCTYLRRVGVEAYHNKKNAVNQIKPGLMLQAERYFILLQTDNLWKEHLKEVKFLQKAVCLRGYAQKDPLTEYKLEGYNLFSRMMAQIRRNVVYNIYSFQPASMVKKGNDT
jgi:preprotein translocase subunit SecA